uniref:Transcriptional regulator, AraC family n=1 Tax=Cyanothece sp. (strain PCC 7425 / ATCC 29141) TaxID=395961 RepID=B8HX82_CYAP4
MTLTLSEHEFDQLWATVKPQDRSLGCDQFEQWLPYPKKLGTGYKRLIQLREGLELIIHDYCLRDHLQVEFTAETNAAETGQPATGMTSDIEIGFYLQGWGRYCQTHAIRAGQNFLFVGADAGEGLLELPGRERILKIDLHVHPQHFSTWTTQLWDALVQAEQDSFNSSGSAGFCQFDHTTPAMDLLLHQILQCPYQGVTEKLYLESKVLELMVLRLHQLGSNNPGRTASRLDKSNCSRLIHPDDVQRIHQAKQILLNNLNNPPSLLALARQVGLNDCTLKRGFRQVLGTTTFGYVHEQRMHWARKLLEQQRMSVKEVAHTVGYLNPSQFTAAFKRTYGITPSSCLRNSLEQQFLRMATPDLGNRSVSG